MISPLSDGYSHFLTDPVEEISLRMAVAATDIAELRAEIRSLHRDLEESRRLMNLRATELLSLMYEGLAKVPAVVPPGATLTGVPVSGSAT